MDIVDEGTRSRMMSGIRGKNTKPELVIRRGLHRAGFRFRLHASDLPGKPDLVLPKWRAVVLVHGCFWHRHEGCRFKTSPGTRPEFWQEKFDANVKRDKSNEAALLAQGWRIATVWECAIKHAPLDALERLSSWIPSDQVTIEIGTNDAGTMPAQRS